MPLEDDLIAQGTWPLCGVDEAGRGPLAGPVVAAAVIMDPASPLRALVKDSKCLSEAKREIIFRQLTRSNEVCIAVSMVDADIIDEINILQATLKAMRQAVERLDSTPLCAIVDGNVSPRLACRCITMVKGDATEPSISAASIVAKVTRDMYMSHMDVLYPGYGFSKHKGYPTRDHMEAISRLGPSRIHRRTFKGVS